MGKNTELLLIEDDPDETHVALRALERLGVDAEVEIARDGEAALARLGLDGGERKRRTPRVVFLDIKLPRVDGWEVLRRIRADPATESIPVVMFSSSDDHEDIRRSYELGANSYVIKHFDERGPGRYLAEAARYWLELNHPAPRNGGTHG